MTENLLTTPSVSGSMQESSSYQVLGTGTTDRVFILGHGDGIPLLDPYQVLDVAQAVRDLNSDPNSPLLRGMLECYYAGAKDIFLVAVDNMSNYILDPGMRTPSYYSNYATNLQVAYNLLLQWDIVQWLIPMEAPFNCSVDFATPLAQHCWDAQIVGGNLCVGVLGTRSHGGLALSDYQTLLSDNRRLTMNTVNDIGRGLCVVVGEGVNNLQEMPFSYSASLATSVVGGLVCKDINRSIVNQPFSNISNLIGANVDNATLTALAQNNFIPVSTTTVGRRGQAFQAIALTDNTFAMQGSNFWSLSQLRTVMYVTAYLQALGRRTLGTVGYAQFKSSVQNFLTSLVTAGYIKNYVLNINKDVNNPYSAKVDVGLTPYLGLRTIMFTTTVGPGQ